MRLHRKDWFRLGGSSAAQIHTSHSAGIVCVSSSTTKLNRYLPSSSGNKTSVSIWNPQQNQRRRRYLWNNMISYRKTGGRGVPLARAKPISKTQITPERNQKQMSRKPRKSATPRMIDAIRGKEFPVIAGTSPCSLEDISWLNRNHCVYHLVLM